jgi:hypothetical protein
MAVSTKKNSNQKPRATDVDFIADFLNADFDAGDVDDLASGDPAFSLFYDLTNLGALGSAKKVQTEVRADLLLLITNAEAVDPSDAYLLLDRLVEKVNKLGLLPQWGVEPVDHDVGVDGSDPKNLQPILVEKEDPAEVKELFAALGPGQKVLKILGGRWIVNTKVGLVGPGIGFDIDALRHRIYWAVIKSLEDGSLARLGICKECNRFFARKRNNQVFCGDECSIAFFNRDAKERRVPKSRARKRREEQLQARKLLDKQAFTRFKEFMRLARKKKHTEPELKTMNPILRGLGGWRRIGSWEKKRENEIWDQLGDGDKRLFRGRR